MKGVYDCEIVDRSEVAPGVVRTVFKGPAIAREAQPGQFVNIRVSKTTDPLLRRPFSVHAVYPDEGLFSVLYVLRGRGTALLAEMQSGEHVSVVGPLGRPFDLGGSPDARHIIVAGGCGAAPLHFLCDALCRKWGCGGVTVLSGAQRRDAVICEAEFRSHGVDVAVSTDDGSYGYHGLVTQLLEERLHELGLPSADARPEVRVYSCGPNPMLKEIARICRQAGVASCQVSLENFMACGIGVCMGCVQKVWGEHARFKRVCTDGPVFEAEEIVWE